MAITKVTDSLVDFDSLGITGNSEVLTITASTGTSQVYQKYSSTGGNHYIGVASSTGAGLLSNAGAYSLNIQTEGARNLALGTNNTLRMLVDSAGSFLFNTTDTDITNDTTGGGTAINSNGWFATKASAQTVAYFNRTGSSDGTIVDFRTDGVVRGRIDISGSTTSYITSSDYRLKENVSYDWDATTRLKQLRPARFNWIEDDTDTLVDGFLAHEVEDIVPEAISGEKDATETYTDDEGNEQTRPVHQGIDQAKLVPLLVKAIQELEARIETLENA